MITVTDLTNYLFVAFRDTNADETRFGGGAVSYTHLIAAQECYNADMTTTFYWGGQGKAIDGLNQKGLGAMYGCLDVYKRQMLSGG